MKNGKCPKCGSATVYAKQGGLGLGDNQGVFVYTGGLTTRTKTADFVCTTCGYFENYIADPNKLSDVARKWPKVPPGTA